MANDLLLTGAGVGGGPHVLAIESPTLALESSFFAYDAGFTGGVRVASAYVNGDTEADLITAAGPGGGPHVRVFDGQSGQVINNFLAFEHTFTGGLQVAAGDINLDGRAELFVAADGPNGGRVRIFDAQTNALLRELIAPAGSLAGGLRIAAGDVNGDGRSDLVMAGGPGNAPRVIVQDLVTDQILLDIMAYSPAFTGGVYVAAGDFSGDGRADIVTGADSGGGPHVRIFHGLTGEEIQGFFAYNPGFSGGVRVATTDFNQDGAVDIVTGAGPGGGPHVRVFRGDNLAELTGFFPYDPSFRGGVYVGASPAPTGTPPGLPPSNPTGFTFGSNVDLAGSHLRIVDSALWGETVSVTASVRNNGNISSGVFQVAWYLSQDPQGSANDILLSRVGSIANTYNHAPLAANSVGPAFAVDLQLPAAPPAGFTGQEFYIVMRTDPLGLVFELNEGNNFGEVGHGKDREPIIVTTTPPPPGPDRGFRIDVVARTSMTPGVAAAFQSAANTWAQIITEDLPDLIGFVDDMRIDAFVFPIDGPLGILGQAGPNAIRIDYANLPFMGQMLFDSADMALMESQGILTDVIMHEMGHVLGVGTLWPFYGLIVNSGTSNPSFRGTAATLEFNRIFGRNDTSVPIEPFVQGHWDESVFDTELMTPFAELGVGMPLSRVTAASLADLGYAVDMDSPFIAPYTPPASALGLLATRTTTASHMHPEHAPGGFLVSGSVNDPEAFERIAEYLREHRPSLEGIPHIEYDAYALAQSREGASMLQTAAELTPTSEWTTASSEMIQPAIDEELVLASPGDGSAATLTEPLTVANQLRATDLVFAKEQAFEDREATSLDQLVEQLTTPLPLSPELLGAALAK